MIFKPAAVTAAPKETKTETLVFIIRKILYFTFTTKYTIISIVFYLKAIWPSGKAVDCKSSIPSSNLGVALKIVGVWWNGRHNRLKIC